MKSKTSVTLSSSLLEELDKVVGKNGNRSRLVEAAVQEYLHKLKRDEHYDRELELLNGQAERLNKEANRLRPGVDDADGVAALVVM